jgi:DNA-binding beta-propeller fold protein YncE
MPWVTGRAPGAALALVIALAAASCSTSSAANHPTPASTASSTSPTLPNPFTILARWSQTSLGLSFGSEDPEDNALAIGPDGNLYVTDSSQRVTVISPEGRVLRRWGGPGKGPGEFNFVSNNGGNTVIGKLAVDSHGLVYVSDSGNARIQVFTPEGRFVRQFGSFGEGSGQFHFAYGVAVDEAGNVYVVDDGRPGVVDKFSPGGKLVWQVGGATSPDPDMRGHLHLTSIDRHGRLVMVNDDLGRVVYLDENGHKVDAFDVRKASCDISIDAFGTTFVTGCELGRFQYAEVFDRTHTLVGQWVGGDEALAIAPVFGPNGEVFALGWDGSLLKLKITLPES